MLSGGIDSPTAAHMLQQQGWELVGLHMDNRPFTDDRETDKTRALAKHLGIPLWMALHGPSQVKIARNADRHLQCLLCRRMMYRTAAALASTGAHLPSAGSCTQSACAAPPQRA